MKFCIQNYEDINKYYSGTFVKFEGLTGEFEGKPLDAGEQIHYIKKVRPDGAEGSRLMEDGTEVEFLFHFSPDEASAPDIEMVFPKKCFFNVEDIGAMFLARYPVRKWKKGITNENTIMQRLAANAFLNVNLDMTALNWYIKKPSYMGFEARKKSYAVSRRFAVSSTGILFCDTKSIGRVDYKKAIVFVCHSMFIPEIKRILKDHGQTFEIEIETKPAVIVIDEEFTVNEEGELVEEE